MALLQGYDWDTHLTQSSESHDTPGCAIQVLRSKH